MTPPPRRERDALGVVDVPAAALWGAQTERGRANFAVSGHGVARQPALIAALGQVKAAAARANAELGVLAPAVAEAVLAAAREVGAGRHDDQFPLDLVQGGGGTASNMNANEVIANRAEVLLGGRPGEYARVHPNDHVNRSQSTNDVYPTALQLAVIRAGEPAVNGLEHLAATCEERAGAFGELQRLGRTCLQDAVPLTVRDTHTAQATAIRRCAAALDHALDGLHAVPLGATAVGTGIGAPPGYRDLAVRYLAEESGLPVVAADDLFDALAHPDGHLAVASAAARAAVVLGKIAADLRLLSSGPHGGLGELRLPAVQVGSSIMPGKVNPAIPELVLQVGFEIRGAAHVVELAVAAGELELNVMEPVVARALLGALHDLGVVARIFADRCIAGLAWNPEALERHLAGSLAAAVEQAGREGYAAASAARRSGAGGS